jgi:hypothetical protein
MKTLIAIACLAILNGIAVAQPQSGITCTFIARHGLPPKVESRNVKVLKANVSPDVGTYEGFVVIGSGRGRLFAGCDGREIYRELAATAAQHGADTVAYQQFGSLVQVRFLATAPDRGTVYSPGTVGRQETSAGNITIDR